ncbi:winged helix-turn-helix transcriptional regulator [Phytomonospora endophytica]|uniref:DNA-binding HxlR family transcriptional regulator n=1 Tax=Phytomonospora endophytica TaxID=714109 RepID=A0A841FR24_9ACTN|nr:helix-turn-helix domain-containing protein [Phytomonospora endophytica]MBB6034410.1 DNA-binding HxlR family transcriptional regulator [Phytomonospora endophytica]GIG66804.1 HxlR family transcriptional regulator [Phytomonospora endophytica]
MAKRGYGQFCGLARGLELVGERWALLIVRDLLVGPRRYTDLRNGLPRIPTNILAARLKELEAAGVVERRVRPRPDGSVVYALTERGAGLEDTVLALGRWGARDMGEPRDGEIVTADSMVMALRTTFRPESAADLRAELRLGAIVLGVVVDGGRLTVAEGPLGDADLVVEGGAGIKALMAGEASVDEALAGDVALVAGDPGGLARFAATFRI